MMRIVRTSSVTVAIAAVLILAFANPASATVPTVKSPLGAGYLTAPAGGITSASVSFVTPKGVTCIASGDFQAMVFGLITDPNSGSDLGDVGAFMVCSGAGPPSLYYAANFIDGGISSALTGVEPGDRLTASAVSNGVALTLKIRDERTGMSVSKTRKQSNPTKLLVGAIGSTTVPTFTTESFSRAKVNGVELGSATPLTREFLKHGTDVQIGASALNST